MMLRGMLAACAFAGLVFAVGCGGPDGSLSPDSPLITFEAPSEADLTGEDPVIEDTGPDEMSPELKKMLEEEDGGAGKGSGEPAAKKTKGGGEASAGGAPDKAKAPPAKKGDAAKKGAPDKKAQPKNGEKAGQP